MRLAGREAGPPQRHVSTHDAGAYVFSELVSGLVFFHATQEEVREHAVLLELDGFPIPQSIRVTGLARALSAHGPERGRLFNMYKLGKDTCATTLLLLHGAARYSSDGTGSEHLPRWISDEHRETMCTDLAAWASKCTRCTELASREHFAWHKRFLLPLYSGRTSGCTSPRKFVLPHQATDCTWHNVHYRLTLGWSLADVADAPHSPVLVLELLEPVGPAVHLPMERCFEERPLFTVTFFFGAGGRSGGVSPPDFGFVDIDGDRVLQSTIGCGFGQRFGDASLAEFRRRTGLKPETVKEAVGSLGSYWAPPKALVLEICRQLRVAHRHSCR